ncbi:MarR family winged helix-turn-helix transcriptional regulator [Sedimenticola selenatireducens]|uniref:MarR family winged helix-turn-helix transcriptional regulator n=1 Tax=Sedimenticola selenatireducens TaxID=191960 RepID=UPI003747AF45
MSFKKRYNFHLHIHFAHLLEERLRNRLAPLGIHPRQARILGVLGMMGQASQAQLAREFGLTAASMSTMTSRLLAAGLIERHVDPQEHRSNVLKLTRHGTNLLEQIHREWQAIDRETTEVLGEENAALYAALSLRLRNAFGGSTPGEECLDKDAVASPSRGENA